MRVIGGTAGGRRLATPRGLATRPTADRVKEALFNILNGAIEQMETCTVLDVFAGTGNLGIEALSRGARHAVFIDSSRDAARLITRNLQTTGFTHQAQVVARDYRVAFTLLAAAGRTFRLVFLDPPYGKEPLEACLTALATSTLLEEGTILVAEHSSRDHFAETYGPLQQWDKRIYGDTALTFYTKPWKGQP